MKEWNARTVTNVNKVCLALGFTALCLSGAKAFAADQPISTPALYGVGDIQVQQTRLANETLTTTCGLSAGEISHISLKSLKNDNLPAFSVVNAQPLKENVLRIDLLPTVATIQVNETSCTSWVGFSAQSRSIVSVPPIKVPRSLVMTYWEGGLLVHSTKEGHPQALVNAIDKLVSQFSRQYRLDQPPEMRPSEEKSTKP